MKRLLSATALAAVGLSMVGSWHIFAINCGDSWQSNGPTTKTGGCGFAAPFSRNPTTEIQHWTLFWTDSVIGRNVNVTAYGECVVGWVTNTNCRPFFGVPYWYTNTPAVGTWNQKTADNYVSQSGACVDRYPEDHFTEKACGGAEGGGCGYAPAVASAGGESEPPAPNIAEGGGGDGCGCDPVEQSNCFNGGGEWSETYCACISPVVVDVAGNGFDLTGGAGGVSFDMDGDGSPNHVAWTAANSDDAWLVLDRNYNGVVDDGTEMFGNVTAQPSAPAGEEKNGFLALGVWDRPERGGNGDGVVDAGDAVFARLRLWQDANHNAVSEPGELHSLTEIGLKAIHLDYHESKRTDAEGNRFRYRAKVDDAKGSKVNRWAWDVFLARAP